MTNPHAAVAVVTGRIVTDLPDRLVLDVDGTQVVAWKSTDTRPWVIVVDQVAVKL